MCEACRVDRGVKGCEGDMVCGAGVALAGTVVGGVCRDCSFTLVSAYRSE